MKTNEDKLKSSKDIQDKELVNFFKEVFIAYKHAESMFMPIKEFILIDTLTICIKFAGPALHKYLTKAFDHIKCQPVNNPDLTIHCFDSFSTKTDLPIMSDSIKNNFYKSSNSDTKNNQVTSVYFSLLNILHLFNNNNMAIYWTKNAKELPYYEKGAPFLEIINNWIAKHKYHLIHAGSVGTKNGGVLLAGKGGSGKSSTALACLEHQNLKFLSDDYCIVNVEKKPIVYSIYSTGKIKNDNFDNFSYLLDKDINNLKEEKTLFFLNDHYKNIIKQMPIKAVISPQVNKKSKKIYLEKISKITALSALAPSSMLQLSGKTTQTLQVLTNIVKQLPCYRLNLGGNIKEVPELIFELLNDLERI
ncbi:serine kinase [Candidatus Margulisiibacteriota bacterium]